MPWEEGGFVDDEPAKTKSSGDRVEALYGGEETPDGEGHGHIVTNDGVNASYVREPAEKRPIVDDEPSSRTYTGYSEGASDRREMAEWMAKEQRKKQRRNKGGRGNYYR
jgi:hypothetical protein